MIKESHLSIEMIIAIFMFSAVYSTRKTDYGIFTACLYNNTNLNLSCSYPNCDDNTAFKCEIFETNGDVRTLIGSLCQLFVEYNPTTHHNKTKTYMCRLSRKASQEERNITVKYGTRKERPMRCSGGPIPPVSGLLWTIAFLFFQETYL